MIEILCILILIVILYVAFKKIKLKYPWILAIVISVFIVVCFKFISPKAKNENEYEGDIIPLKNEVKNIASYEQAVKLILANNKRVDSENKVISKIFSDTGVARRNNLADSMYTVLKGRLRFPSYTVKIVGKDTTITFESNRGDFYMRSNHKDKEANYTRFWHSIIYTNKKLIEFRNEDDPEDKPSAMIKIKDKYYYSIWSSFEY